MNRKVTLLYLLAFLPFCLSSQPFIMDGTPINACDGTILDSGGSTNDYAPNENITTTICPDGGSGTHIQLLFNGVDLGLEDDLCFYDGQDTMANLLTCLSDFSDNTNIIVQATAANPSGCLTLNFVSDATDEGAGWMANINCIASCQLIQAVLVSTDPLVEPADTGWIDICPGERVFFEGAGIYPQNGIAYNHSDATSTFEWDFGDGTIGFGPSVSHVYNDAQGYVVQLKITDQFGCTNTNFITQRIRVATQPTFNIGGTLDPEICAGDTVMLNAMVNQVDNNSNVSVLPNEGSFQIGGIRSDSLALPDGDGVSYQTSISFSDFSPGQVLSDVNDLMSICVVMEHSFMRDLEIMLTCPSGESIILHNHPGQDGGEVFLGDPVTSDEFGNPIPGDGFQYCWTPSASNGTWIEYANTFFPPTLPEGDYESFESLSNFIGCPLNGEWTITVTDLWPIDNGFIFSWGINFIEDLYPDLEKYTPNFIDWEWDESPSVYFQTMDSIGASPTNAGMADYKFTVFDDFGCSWDTSINFNVLPFSHPDCYNCTDILDPLSDTLVCVGEPVEFDVFAEVPSDIASTYEDFPKKDFNPTNHPASNPYVSEIEVVAMNPMSIEDPLVDIISVCVDITSDFDQDIAIWLEAPNGSLLELSTNNGGSGRDYTQTCFTPTAATSITAGTAPFTGNFQPEEDWNVLIGSPINGPWSLLVSDAFGNTTFSTLNQWNITFNYVNEVSYSWLGNDLSCIDCPNPTVMPTSMTTYTINATDSNQCLDTETVTVNILQNFDAPVIDWEILQNGDLEITWTEVGIGLDYEINIDGNGWMDPNDSNTRHLISGLSNGDAVNIQVRVKVGNTSCAVEIGQTTAFFLLCTLDAFPDPNWPTPYMVSCPGNCDASLPISAVNGTAPFTYNLFNLNDGSTNILNNGFFTGLCAAEYRIIVEDNAGCRDTVFFEVVEPDPISATIMETESITCFGEDDGQLTVSATGGTGTLSFEWDDDLSQIGAEANNLPANVYMVMVSDENNCQGMATYVLAEPLPVVISTAQTDVICFGENNGSASVFPSGGVGNFEFQWSAGSSPTSSITGGLSAGTVMVTVEDMNGCEIDTTLIIDQPATAVSAVINQTVESCFGEDESVAVATGAGGLGNYMYSWSNGDNTDTATDLATQIYSVTVSDMNNCSVVEDIMITELAEMDFSFNFSRPNCAGFADGGIGAQGITGGAGQPYIYAWSNGADEAVNLDIPGNETYELTITDAQGCTVTNALFLEDAALVEFDILVQNVLCFGDNTGSATVENVQNTTGDLAYLWGQNANGQTTQTASGLNIGGYSVTITDENGCTAENTTTISEPTMLETSFDIVDNDCFGQQEGVVEVSIAGGVGNYSFVWTDLNSSDATIEGLGSQFYTISITDGNDCLLMDSAFVDQPQPINVDVLPSPVTCFGGRDGVFELFPQGGTAPFSYSINGDDFLGTNRLIGLTAGEYDISIRDANGCFENQKGTISSPDELTVDILSNSQIQDQLTINLGDTIPLDVLQLGNQGDIDIFWSATFCGTMSCGDTLTDCLETIFCDQPIIFPQDPITYRLDIVDEAGCVASDQLVVFLNKQRTVLVPTGFTPQSGDINNALHVHGKEGTKVNIFRVFDRWGELLFEVEDFNINDLKIGWDGTFRGEDMPTGVYVWYLIAEYEDGEKEAFKGETTLLR